MKVLASLTLTASSLLVPVFVGLKAHAQTSRACQSFKRIAHGQINQENGFNTEALVVLKNGKPVYQWHDAENQVTTPHVMWSVSKMVTATIMGAAAEQGKLSLDDSVAQYFPPSSLATDSYLANYRKLKIHHLMSFTAGIAWQEAGSDAVQKSSVAHMLYSVGYHDVVQTYLHQPMPYEPGTMFTYASGNANLQMAILRKIYGKDYDRAPWDLLFKPLGLTSARFEQDAAGNYIGGSYLYLSARDMAKVGQFYLDEGIVNGRRIVPHEWIRRAQTLVQPIRDFISKPQDAVDIGLWSEGGFWLNQSVKGFPKPFAHSPEDMYFSAGRSGQLLFVIPSKRLVIARTGYDEDYWPQIDAFVSSAVACFGPGNAKGVVK